MKKLVCIAISLLGILSLTANAQTSSIRGKLIDSAGGKPITDATLSLLQVKDSSLVTYTISTAQGAFEMKIAAPGNYRLVISHQTFGEMKKELTINPGQKELDLGEVVFQKDYRTLGEVIVTSESPIVIKN